MSNIIFSVNKIKSTKTAAEIKQLNDDALTQRSIDAFYDKNGPCCAGCDNWRWVGSTVGECIKTAPMSQNGRVSMLDIDSCSLASGPGHIMTKRDHFCGEFIDN